MEQDQQQNPAELIGRFERCPNFPKTPEGIVFLAQGLAQAARTTGIDATDIVDACAAIGRFCPTDHELLNVARNIRDRRQTEAESKRNRTAEWERQYGKPEPYDWKAETSKIMADASEYWRKDRKILDLMRKTAAAHGIKLKKLSHSTWFSMQVWAQEKVGLPVTPEQRKEMNRIGIVFDGARWQDA